jgi:hypothetical protein
MCIVTSLKVVPPQHPSKIHDTMGGEKESGTDEEQEQIEATLGRR